MKSNPLWWRIPLILTCIFIAATTLLVTTVARAASGMPEFGEILASGLDALSTFFDAGASEGGLAGLKAHYEWLLELLQVIW